VSVAETIERLVAEVCAIPSSTLQRDRPLVEYGLDSARAIDLIVSLESEFDLRISDTDARTMRTIEDIVVYLRRKVPARGA
jgi:acyl carrier protein